MKKTIKSLLAIAVAALTFHSCADVPAPYQIPDSGGSGGNLPEGVIFKQVFSSDKGDFIIKNLSLAEGLSGSDIWTTGASYIKATTYLQLSGETAKKNHHADSWLISPKVSLKDMTTAYVILNHSTGYLNGAKPATCLKVMVSDNYTDGAAINVDDWKDIEIDNWYTGTSFEFVNGNGDLKDFIGKENVHVALRYIGTESTSPTWEISSLTIADTPVKPEEKEMPKDLTGKGTPEDPYTVADAHKIIDVFGSSESPEVYVKGKVVSREFSSQHSSMTYFISDTGSEDNKLEVYGGKYFNKQGFTSESQLNVGDVVIVVGKLVNYQGKTREFTNGNYIYMLNGQTSGGEVDPQPQPVDPTGENLLANGDFELWTSGLPDNWKSTTTASNATLTQSTDTHSGSYAVKIAHDAAANKRMAYKEITLKAGTYLLAFYVKGSDGTASVRPGYTNILENGKANSTYTYGDYVNDIPQNEWKLVNHTFTLASETKLNLVIMVPKNSASDPLVDDVTLTTSDGGMADGGQGGGSSESISLTNGDFETWANGLPTGWKSASTASTATLEQSTDAHGGSYSCIVKGDEGTNKRLATQEITLPAGTYVFSAWVKASTSDASQARLGYVPIGADGKAGTYIYANYVNLSTSWQQFSHEFTLDSEKKVCLVIMNPKKSNYSSGKDILVDDATLTKK